MNNYASVNPNSSYVVLVKDLYYECQIVLGLLLLDVAVGRGHRAAVRETR